MNTETFKHRAGRWVRQSEGPEPFSSFVPRALPPDPPVIFSGSLLTRLEKAGLALGQLNVVHALIPDPELFIYTYIRKEAILSSQIEGTQSSLSDLLLFEIKEAPGVPVADVKEVLNYVAAMQHGLRRLKAGLPLSLRLIKEIHAILMKGVRGGEKDPGEFRRSQNWIGGSRPGNAAYVPPPVHEVLPAMGDLEKFLHQDSGSMPVLVQAGLAHVQFETIHPFLDGNGRLGRLLVTFLLCANGTLVEPLLYLSLYFKRNRKTYYEMLQRVRTDGDWESWISFFLTGVEEVAAEAIGTIQKLHSLFEEDRKKIVTLGKAASTALRLHETMKKHPLLSLAAAEKYLDLSFPAVNKAMLNLGKLGIVREFTGKQRNRLFSYEAYLKILNEGTEQIPSDRR